jgi:DNA-binding NarL/FixJ family response regulator
VKGRPLSSLFSSSVARKRTDERVSDREIITVVVGRFDPLVRPGLADALEGDRGVCVLASGLEEADLEELVVRKAPRVVILDEPATSSALVERLGEVAPAVGVIVLAHHPSRDYGMRILGAGATCLARNASAADLLGAIHLVARGERAFISADGYRVERRHRSDVAPLTPREEQVLTHLSRARSYGEIAAALKVSPETVRKHTANICRKLHVQSRQDLIGMPVGPTGSSS